MGASHDGTVVFDIGMQRALGPGTLGVVVQNLGVGPRIDGVMGTLPRRIGVGFSGYRPVSPHWDIGAQTGLTLEGDLFVRPAGGAELAYVPVEGVSFTVRQGFRLPRERDESLYTAGVGVTIDRYSLDYAMEPMRGGLRSRIAWACGFADDRLHASAAANITGARLARCTDDRTPDSRCLARPGFLPHRPSAVALRHMALHVHRPLRDACGVMRCGTTDRMDVPPAVADCTSSSAHHA